jgi:hypothetical protein
MTAEDPGGQALDRFNDLLDRRGPRRVAVAVVLLAILAGTTVFVHRTVKDTGEYPGFRLVARTAVIDGADVYDAIPHKRAYPPFFSVVFLPFVLGPPAVGATLYALFNIVSVLLSTWLVLRALTPAARPVRFGTWFLLFLATGGILLDVLGLGETDLIVLLFLAGGAHALFCRNRPFVAGMLFSLPAVFKLVPAFLGFYFLVRRRWRVAGGMVAGAVLLVGGLGSVVFGPAGNLERHERWWQEVMTPAMHDGARGIIDHPYRTINQSLTAVTYRYLAAPDVPGQGRGRLPFPKVAALSDRTVRLVARILSLGLLAGLVLLWLLRRGADTVRLRAAALSTALIGMLELSEVSLTTHHAVLVFPMAVLLTTSGAADARPGERRTAARGAILGTLLIWACAVRPLKNLSLLFFTTLILLGLTTWLLLRAAPEGPEADQRSSRSRTGT